MTSDPAATPSDTSRSRALDCAEASVPQPLRLSIIVTTYAPDAQFVARFKPLLGTSRSIIVVDNTPGGHRFGKLPDGFVLLQDRVNKGLGLALNEGISQARGQGSEWVVLFDQDSTPDAALIERLLAAGAEAAGRHGERCGVGPVHVDDVTARMTGWHQAVPGDSDVLQNVSCLPTSGLTFPIAPIGSAQLFSPDLFLDLVDFEWCWRLRQQGWSFHRATQIRMLHRLGIAERRWLGLSFFVPAPYRHYFQVRDTLRMATRSYVPLYAKLRLCGVLPLKALLFPLLLDRGTERLAWMWRGLIDACRGVGGIGAARGRLGGR